MSTRFHSKECQFRCNVYTNLRIKWKESFWYGIYGKETFHTTCCSELLDYIIYMERLYEINKKKNREKEKGCEVGQGIEEEIKSIKITFFWSHRKH